MVHEQVSSGCIPNSHYLSPIPTGSGRSPLSLALTPCRVPIYGSITTFTFLIVFNREQPRKSLHKRIHSHNDSHLLPIATRGNVNLVRLCPDPYTLAVPFCPLPSRPLLLFFLCYHWLLYTHLFLYPQEICWRPQVSLMSRKARASDS